ACIADEWAGAACAFSPFAEGDLRSSAAPASAREERRTSRRFMIDLPTGATVMSARGNPELAAGADCDVSRQGDSSLPLLSLATVDVLDSTAVQAHAAARTQTGRTEGSR